MYENLNLWSSPGLFDPASDPRPPEVRLHVHIGFGWMAQLNEMIGDPEYTIGRPRQLFTGSEAREVKPIGQRQAVTLLRYRRVNPPDGNIVGFFSPCVFLIAIFLIAACARFTWATGLKCL